MSNIFDKIYRWIGADGILHIGACFFIAVLLGALMPPYIAGIVAMAIGFGKEIYDKLHPESHDASWHDILCDLIGTLIGVGIGYLYILVR